jgi:hypothetical protein
MSKNLKQYTDVSYSGRELLKKHKLNEYGVWRIKGEDPNCDMGGYHHQPDLGLYEGRLDEVIAYAVELPGFWTWGGGGSITKTEVELPKKIDAKSIANRRAKEVERKELEARLKELNKELGAR